MAVRNGAPQAAARGGGSDGRGRRPAAPAAAPAAGPSRAAEGGRGGRARESPGLSLAAMASVSYRDANVHVQAAASASRTDGQSPVGDGWSAAQPPGDQRGKKDKRERKRQEKREERDRLLLERQVQDDERMVHSRGLYHESLLKSLPLQPPAVYPSVVDPRDGVYVPLPAVREFVLPACPASQVAQQREAAFLQRANALERSLLSVLAREVQNLHDAGLDVSPDEVTPFDLAVAEGVRQWRLRASVVGALAAAAVATPPRRPQAGAAPSSPLSLPAGLLTEGDAARRIQKGWRRSVAVRRGGHGVIVSGLPTGALFNADAIEMAFFAHGDLHHHIMNPIKGIAAFWYVHRGDADLAIRKMHGRLWKGSSLTVHALCGAPQP
eukprot:TRINITY_DN12866_c0_g3_i1.p1 TRINITY_DN12866_c0_g3~~TRINITY_DN12866_c0_g3_i1.p1  ORF type:complete len:411 (+),score=110.87 TRINITY_DN12866_c0_g3_i1:89-1234(+)